MRTKGFIYTILAGIAVGATVGMLYAPGKGADTRRKLKKLKRKMGLGADIEDLDRETLEVLRESMHEQLEKIDAALDKG